MEWVFAAVVGVLAFLLGYAVRSMKGNSTDSFRVNTPTRAGQPVNGVPAELAAKPAEAKQVSSDAMSQVEDFILRGKKIEAIKAYREATGVGLKEAKDAVEAIQRKLLNPSNSA